MLTTPCIGVGVADADADVDVDAVVLACGCDCTGTPALLADMGEDTAAGAKGHELLIEKAGRASILIGEAVTLAAVSTAELAEAEEPINAEVAAEVPGVVALPVNAEELLLVVVLVAVHPPCCCGCAGEVTIASGVPCEATADLGCVERFTCRVG